MNEHEQKLVDFLDRVMNFSVKWRLKLIPANPYFASSARRMMAVFIDLLIYLGISAVFMLIFFEPSAHNIGEGHLRNFFGEATSIIFLFFFVLLPTPLLSTMLLCRRGKRNGQTFGKQMMSIQVKRDDGLPWTFRTAVKRQVLYKMLFISFVSMFPMAAASILYENAHQPFLGSAVFVLMFVGWFIYGLLPMRNDRRKAWHDKRVHSHVARVDVKSSNAA